MAGAGLLGLSLRVLWSLILWLENGFLEGGKESQQQLGVHPAQLPQLAGSELKHTSLCPGFLLAESLEESLFCAFSGGRMFDMIVLIMVPTPWPYPRRAMRWHMVQARCAPVSLPGPSDICV